MFQNTLKELIIRIVYNVIKLEIYYQCNNKFWVILDIIKFSLKIKFYKHV